MWYLANKDQDREVQNCVHSNYNLSGKREYSKGVIGQAHLLHNLQHPSRNHLILTSKRCNPR